MKKLLLLLVLLGGICGSSVAQPLSFGVKAGVSFPYQKLKYADVESSIKPQTIVGFHAGGELLFQLPFIELEGDVLFCSKGSKYSYTPEGGLEKIETRQTLYYLDIPLKINYAIGFSDTGIFFGLGPTFSMGLFGNQKTTGTAQRAIKWGDEKTQNALSRFDIAIGFQAGIRFMGAQLSAFYDLGLYNTSSSKGNTSKNRVWGLSLGYLF